MESQDEDPCVVLILGDSQFIVNRKQLIHKSQYFASLFSKNYIDHLRQEHIINYDIPVNILKDYISWIQDEDLSIKFDFIIKTSLAKYCDCNLYEDLLKLLHLSVLFLTDLLTEEIITLIEYTLTMPEYLIDIWLVAMDLGLSTLQDVFFDLCLDCFNQLPMEKLTRLEYHNLMKLLNNVNISSTDARIRDVFSNWIQFNKMQISSFEIPNSMMSEKPKIFHFIVDYEKPQNRDSKIFLYCWNGESFFKDTTLTFPEEITESPQVLVGMQFIGRRYNLYLCGGEYGLGRGKFNEKIWRYSFIAKKWFVNANMPAPRRHMITVFFNNNLYLIGGVGRYRKQLNSVSIFNTHSRIWSSGADIPETFTKIPEYCVNENYLIIYMSHLNILVYYPTEDVWRDLKLLTNKFISQEVILMGSDDTCFIDVTNKGVSDDIVVRCIEYDSSVTKCTTESDYTCEQIFVHSTPRVHPVDSNIPTSLETYIISLTGNNMYVWHCNRIPSDKMTQFERVHVHTFSVQEPITFDSFFSSYSSVTRKFFYMMNRDNLYTESTVAIKPL